MKTQKVCKHITAYSVSVISDEMSGNVDRQDLFFFSHPPQLGM